MVWVPTVDIFITWFNNLIVQWHDQKYFTLTYPFCCCCCLFSIWLFLLQLSQINWCEQTWNLLVVVQVMEMQLSRLGPIMFFSLSWEYSSCLLFCQFLALWKTCWDNCSFSNHLLWHLFKPWLLLSGILWIIVMVENNILCRVLYLYYILCDVLF